MFEEKTVFRNALMKLTVARDYIMTQRGAYTPAKIKPYSACFFIGSPVAAGVPLFKYPRQILGCDLIRRCDLDEIVRQAVRKYSPQFIRRKLRLSLFV